MGNKRISDLTVTETLPLAGTELIELSRSGTSRRGQWQSLFGTGWWAALKAGLSAFVSPNATYATTAGDATTLGGESPSDFHDVAQLVGEFAAPITASALYTVGSGGNYATLNAALEALSMKYPQYKAAGVRVTLQLVSGYIMTEQVLVDAVDLGWITITSVDAEVTIDRASLTVAFEGFYPAFGVKGGGRLPVIGALFSMNTMGTAMIFGMPFLHS